MSGPEVDHYKILEIDSKATSQQIREAYKRQALKHHPDRVPTTSPERPRRTRRFQAINDAYYTLSDPARRKDYDASRRYSSFTSAPSPNARPSGTQKGSTPGGFSDDTSFDYDEEVPHQDGTQQQGAAGWGSFFTSFPWSTFGFGGSAQKADGAQSEDAQGSAQFASVFEEMMREQGMADDTDGTRAKPTGKFWSLLGGVSGGAMGFIVANVPGAVAGSVAGNRLGAVRDARGKSVYSVFKELPQADRGRLLSELAAKVFAHAVSG